MRKTLSIVFAAATLNAQIAAAQTPSASLDLRGQELVSLIYSGVHNKALVGVVNSYDIVHFEECQAPELAVGQSIGIDSLTSCVALENTSFRMDEELVNRINASYSRALPGIFVEEQKKLNHDRNTESAKLGALSLILGTVSVAAGLAGVSVTSELTRNLWSSGKRVRAVGTGVLWVGFAVLQIGGAIAAVASPWIWGGGSRFGAGISTRIEPIEKVTSEEQRHLVITEKISQENILGEKDMPALYPAMKRALLQSIIEAGTL